MVRPHTYIRPLKKVPDLLSKNKSGTFLATHKKTRSRAARFLVLNELLV
jgi:hypothetical protein